MFKYILDRLSEPSTWRGLIGFVAATGVVIEPAMADRIIAAGLALAGIVAMLTRDSAKKE